MKEKMILLFVFKNKRLANKFRFNFQFNHWLYPVIPLKTKSHKSKLLPYKLFRIRNAWDGGTCGSKHCFKKRGHFISYSYLVDQEQNQTFIPFWRYLFYHPHVIIFSIPYSRSFFDFETISNREKKCFCWQCCHQSNSKKRYYFSLLLKQRDRGYVEKKEGNARH